jgi:midasin
MLDMAHKAFLNAGRNADAAKLLLILSDGRGIFNEGQDRVLDAVRNVLLSGTFVIFLIVENVTNKDSVLDMRIATFDENNKPTIVSYMEQFPFPYYMILKNINALPQSLSDALRQWFSFVAN